MFYLKTIDKKPIYNIQKALDNNTSRYIRK